MRPPSQGQISHPAAAADCELFEPEARGGDAAPQSNFCARPSKDTSLAELAIRIASAPSLDQALECAVVTLSEQLPDCRIEVAASAQAPQRDPAASDGSVRFGRESAVSECCRMGETPGRCEWRLTEDASGPMLSIALEQVRQPREVARVIDLGERVATLLGAAVRHARQRETLLRQTQELLDLRRRVIQAEKLATFGQLAASVLHDLNNPLTAILAYSDYLKRALANAGVCSADLERLSRIGDAADMVLRRTRSLVEYACPPRRAPSIVDLASVVQRALLLCEHDLDGAGLAVDSKLGHPMPAVRGQAEDLVQLFVNLFTNAAHAACASNPRLTLRAHGGEDPNVVRIEVQDNGKGILPEDLEHVFDPFYTTSTEGGSGLGLSIVKDIVRQHGGQISVQSTPHVGTTFYLLLPVATD